MALDARALNIAVDAITALALRIAAHTGDPGAADTASNEVTGGSPAYARKAIAWGASSGGVGTASSQPVFDIPASTTVSWVSLWNTAGTNRYSKKQLSANESFGSQGTLTVTSATITLTSS
jgi:hypothetical protein